MAAPHAEWLVFAEAGPALELPGLLPSTRIRVVTSAAAFERTLTLERPRVAVIASPPASAEQVALLAAERRRRRSLRAVLLNRHDAVTARLDALAAGLDEAFDDAVSGAELAGRLVVLADRARADRDPSVVRLSAVLEVLAAEPGRVLDRGSCSGAHGARTAARIHGPWTSTSAGCGRRSSRTRSTPCTW